MRTTIGHARRQSKKRLFKRAKGYRGGRSKLTRTVKETLLRSGAYAYRDRRVRKREFRKLWIIRINAACHQHDLRYSEFIHGLKLANIELDRKSLSEMAIHDAAGFKDVVDAVKKALAEKPTPAASTSTAATDASSN
ncbi:MAG: 50S ribosomal protein L20 [Planctomycetota bacterium]